MVNKKRIYAKIEYEHNFPVAIKIGEIKLLVEGVSEGKYSSDDKFCNDEIKRILSEICNMYNENDHIENAIKDYEEGKSFLHWRYFPML